MEKIPQKGTGTVSAIYISRAKGQPREEIPRGQFLLNHGLDGDAWSGPGDRQVLMLTKKARQDVDADTRNGLCYSRFKETLQIEELPLENFPLGTQLRAGEAVFEIAEKGKRCFPECEIIRSGSRCALKRNAVFLRVLQSGSVSVGDPVEAAHSFHH
jgi:MOSC domain-containing protein YiiM